MKKVIVGLSGGVDSAVSCFLLKNAGYEVEAIFMQNWDSYINQEHNINSTNIGCQSKTDYNDALKIAEHLNIKLHKINFIKEYWDKVFLNFINEYKNGRTPNPDILCNQYIKFGAFIKYIEKNFSCDYIAMGHYANIKHKNNSHHLLKAKDKNKDQTYFLCNLNQDQLTKVLFPLGKLKKKKVRAIAKKNNLPVWNKKDSTGICFIGERNFQQFLENYIKKEKGDIIDIVTKKKLGEHQGISFYTVGQNSYLNLSGYKEKYYVCKKDVKNNIIYAVDDTHQKKYLTSYECRVNNFHWIYQPKKLNHLKVRFRHRQKLIPCKIEYSDNQVIIKYSKGQRAVTEGQSAVLYRGKKCLGGGVIEQITK